MNSGVLKLTDAYEKYIKALEDELSSVSTIAYVHGWRSEKYEEGVKLREEIIVSRKELEEDINKVEEEKDWLPTDYQERFNEKHLAVEEAAEAKWESFQDTSYYGYWAVRPVGDKSFNSQQLFHVISKEEADVLRDIFNHLNNKIKAQTEFICGQVMEIDSLLELNRKIGEQSSSK